MHIYIYIYIHMYIKITNNPSTTRDVASCLCVHPSYGGPGFRTGVRPLHVVPIYLYLSLSLCLSVSLSLSLSPRILDFPLQVIPPYIYEGFPLYELFPCMRDFHLPRMSWGCPF